MPALIDFYMAHKELFAQRFWPDARLPPPPFRKFDREAQIEHHHKREAMSPADRPTRAHATSDASRQARPWANANVDQLMADMDNLSIHSECSDISIRPPLMWRDVQAVTRQRRTR